MFPNKVNQQFIGSKWSKNSELKWLLDLVKTGIFPYTWKHECMSQHLKFDAMVISSK